MVGKPITIQDTLLLSKEIIQTEIAPARIDIGRLATEWINEKAAYASVTEFIADKLTAFLGTDKRVLKPKDIVLYGFGRIGRIAARELIIQAGKGEQLRLRAIVTRSNSDEDISKRAALLRTDSVHGPFPGTIIEDFENKALIINYLKQIRIQFNLKQNVFLTSIEYADFLDFTSFLMNVGLVSINNVHHEDTLTPHPCSIGFAARFEPQPKGSKSKRKQRGAGLRKQFGRLFRYTHRRIRERPS
jgi:glyceraldehyde 3-phosphate dehydrogenase